MKTCPRCYASAHRSRRRGLVIDWLFSAAGLRPYVCPKCFHRFHRKAEIQDHSSAAFRPAFWLNEQPGAGKRTPLEDLVRQIRDAEARTFRQGPSWS